MEPVVPLFRWAVRRSFHLERMNDSDFFCATRLRWVVRFPRA